MSETDFIGLQYPLVETARGLMAQSYGVEQIKADLLQLLLTNPGERVMLPQYGTPLRKLIFEPNDASLQLQAQQMIANSISMWEPRIVVTGITVTNSMVKSRLNPSDDGTEIDNILGITISFVDPQNISTVESLVLEMPIGA